MKRIALIALLAAGVLQVNAQQLQASGAPTDQAVSGGPSAPTNVSSAAKMNAMDMFGATTMDMNNKVVRFSNVPQDHVVKAYITDASGEMVKNKRLSAADNTIDCSRMPAGLYYVTIMNKNKRKCFKINL